MKRIYSILVENRAGVLCKTAGLFWRRCFNIDSITVGETDDKNVSSMVIVSSGDNRTLEQIENGGAAYRRQAGSYHTFNMGRSPLASLCLCYFLQLFCCRGRFFWCC